VSASAESAVAPSGPKNLELHIASNGLSYLKGARILSVGQNSLEVDVQWGSAEFPWHISLTPSTHYVDTRGEKLRLSDLREGQFVSITGPLLTDESVPSVKAQYVRVAQ
jgi:hypothetical protein